MWKSTKLTEYNVLYAFKINYQKLERKLFYFIYLYICFSTTTYDRFPKMLKKEKERCSSVINFKTNVYCNGCICLELKSKDTLV